MFKPEDYFDLKNYSHKSLFQGVEYVWEALPKIKSYIKDMIQPNIAALRKNGSLVCSTTVLYKGKVIDKGFTIEEGNVTKGKLKVFHDGQELEGACVVYEGAVLFDNAIELGEGSVVEPGALIKGPTIIGKNTEVRQGAYVRGTCLIGNRCVVGHTTELKSTVMLNGAKAGHFAYLGDSILGSEVNLGAGTKIANLKMTENEIVLKTKEKSFPTGLRKFGAIMADHVQMGCNSVTSPGTVLGKGIFVYPNVTVLPGIYPAYSRIFYAKAIVNVELSE